jgi:serine/threonine-protein phosphatase 2A regulatory subunit A
MAIVVNTSNNAANNASTTTTTTSSSSALSSSANAATSSASASQSQPYADQSNLSTHSSSTYLNGSVDSIDPIEILRQGFTSGEYEETISSIDKIIPIGICIGAQRVRTVLLSYLYDLCNTIENDEILTGIAASLYALGSIMLNDTTNNISTLSNTQFYPLLEKLCSEEEYIVRETACSSLVQLLQPLAASTHAHTDVVQHIMPLLKRLANGDWFTTRVSACNLIAPLYAVLASPSTSVPSDSTHQYDTIRTELRTLYSTLANDDTPMVKKKAYGELNAYASILPKIYYKSDIYPVLKLIVNDDLDSIRM